MREDRPVEAYAHNKKPLKFTGAKAEEKAGIENKSRNASFT
jgi:hypothetical protein